MRWHNSGQVPTSEELAKFWDELELILDAPKHLQCSQDEMNGKLVNYIKSASDAYNNNYIVSDQDLYRMALVLTESSTFKNHKEFCLGKLQSLMSLEMLEMNMKFVIAYILLWESKKDLRSLQLMVNLQGFTVIYNTLYTQFAYISKYGDEVSQDNEIELNILVEMRKIATLLMDILFQIFKYSKCNKEHILMIDEFFVHHMLQTVHFDVPTDLYNNAKFKLLLSLNEQYMMFSKSNEVKNNVYKYLICDSTSKSFTSLLLLKFNRETNKSLQIMMCKILYLILTTTDDDIAMNFFYLNDLNVFLDVLIRKLQNISENDELLRNTFLRVMIPLLNNTELSRTHYRKEDINELLEHLSYIHNICISDEITPEQRTTVRLANKCLASVTWLDSALANEDVSADSDTSISRIKLTVPVKHTSKAGSVPALVAERNPNTSSYWQSKKKYSSSDALDKRKGKKLPPPPPPPSRVISRSNSKE